MKKETYERIFNRVDAVPYGRKMIAWLSRLLTDVTAVLYFVAMGLLVWQGQYRQAGTVVFVPAVTFVLVSLVRHLINARRPYEVHGFQPLISKDSEGHSFPSRHVFSIFVIGTTIFWYYPAAAVAVWLMGIALAVIRVVSGVHFPRDVIAGMVVGILCGCLACIFPIP